MNNTNYRYNNRCEICGKLISKKSIENRTSLTKRSFLGVFGKKLFYHDECLNHLKK